MNIVHELAPQARIDFNTDRRTSNPALSNANVVAARWIILAKP